MNIHKEIFLKIKLLNVVNKAQISLLLCKQTMGGKKTMNLRLTQTEYENLNLLRCCRKFTIRMCEVFVMQINCSLDTTVNLYGKSLCRKSYLNP